MIPVPSRVYLKLDWVQGATSPRLACLLPPKDQTDIESVKAVVGIST
jgi:hypothetical protein